MKDLMLDLETFHNKTDAAIVQIGACYFDPKDGSIGDVFVVNIDPEDEQRHGFMVGAGTVIWWLGQSEQARLSIINGAKLMTHDAIKEFNTFASKAERIWSHSTFDFAIIMHHFEVLDIKPTFHYKTARDIRTLTDLARVPFKNMTRDGIHHNALDDAKFQIKYCCECLSRIDQSLLK